MNRLQANLCLLCVTLCWSSEVILYACIPENVPAFATMCVKSLAGAALLAWWFWAHVSRTPFSLRSPRDLLLHTLVLVAKAVLETAIVAPAVALVYPEEPIQLLTWTVFGNTAIFPIVLGIPLAILLQEEFGFVPFDRRLPSR